MMLVLLVITGEKLRFSSLTVSSIHEHAIQTPRALVVDHISLLAQLLMQLRTSPGWVRLGQRLQSLLNAGVIPRPAS